MKMNEVKCSKHVAAGLALTALSAALLSACGGGDGDGSTDAVAQPLSAKQACETMNGKTIGDAKLKATVMPASGEVPVYCKVEGLIGKALNFELRLPESWNSKLHYFGGGGYDGYIQTVTGGDANLRIPLVALKAGYATVSSDGGHQGHLLDASFALNDPEAALMFGSLSVPTVTTSVQKLLATVYGAAPAKSYYEGCSNGGREGMQTMQRYPKLFDGMVIRAPAYNWVGLLGHFAKNSKAVNAPGAQLSTAKVALVAKTVRSACDALDGVVDGLVSNPAACTTQRVNLPALRCEGGAEGGDTCLSDPQLAMLGSWTSDAVFNGAPTFRNAGWNLSGNEDDPAGMEPWVTGYGDARKSFQFMFSDTTVKNYLAKDPGVDSMLYDFGQNVSAVQALGALNDATNPDISPFISNGGKLILWHGAADPAINVNSSIEYFGRMRAAVGEASANSASRFYVAPGVTHCATGPGADTVDLLAALDQWSAKGSAPGTLRAAKVDDKGAEVLSRPLCEYPKYARYVGPAGDAAAANQAANYQCTAP